MKLLIISFFILYSTITCCQTHFNISGFVSDNNKKPIDVADVILVSKENRKIIAYTFVDNGVFYVNNIKKGTYLLKINTLSHAEFIKVITVDKNLELQLSLTPKTEVLNEIEITARKNLIENKKGNLLITVENSMLSKEATTGNLLTKLPKIRFNEAQESIEIIGKGTPLIYINNQQVSFEMLVTLQVDEIKSIEIINNPSSKYEANASSVLRITLKKSKTDGLKMTLKETASLKTYFNNYISSHLSIKRKAIETKLGLSFNTINVWESNSAFYQISDKNIQSDYSVEAITNRKQAVLNGGFYYQINDKDYFSINSNTQIQEEPFSLNTTTNYTENDVYDFIDTKSKNISNRFVTTSIVNYQKYFKNTDALFLGAQHSYYHQKINNTIVNTFNNVNSNINREQIFAINSYSFRINYEKQLSEHKKLEFGTNYSNTKTVTKNTATYNFKEENKALYGQFSNKIFNKLTYSFGLRLEENNTSGNFEDNKTDIYQQKNTSVFPKASIHYPFNKEHSLTFNYNKSTNRPNFSSLVNTSAFINPYLEFTGNLTLTNAITNEVSLTYQLNKKAITFQYSHTNKPIQPYTFDYNSLEEKTILQPLNLIHKTSVSLETSFPLKYGIWSSNNIINLMYTNIKDNRAIKTYLKPYVYYYSNQQIHINKSTSFNLNLWGTTLKGEGALITKPVFVASTSILKKIKNIDITVSYNDIFKSFTFGEKYFLKNISVDNLFLIDVNEISLSLKYNFGKIKKSTYKNKNITDVNRIR